MNTVGEPIVSNLYLGGMCGPEGSSSHESFHRRKQIQLNVFIQEDGLAFYAENDNKDTAELLSQLLQNAVRRYFIENPDAPWTSFGPRPTEQESNA